MNKMNPAFTLMEVLIATVVVASSIYVLSNLHIRSRLKVLRSAEEIERVFFVKKYLYQLYLQPPTKSKPFKATIEKPDMRITTHKADINPKKSSLRRFAKEIDIIWSEGTWERPGDTPLIKMISFVPKPKQDPK